VQKRGPKPKLDEKDRRIAEQDKRIAKLEAKLALNAQLLELQKKQACVPGRTHEGMKAASLGT
jgi:hypothetical protein